MAKNAVICRIDEPADFVVEKKVGRLRLYIDQAPNLYF